MHGAEDWVDVGSDELMSDVKDAGS